MQRWKCPECGFEYDESIGLPEAGVAPGTRWADLPDDWVCPVCGEPKRNFERVT